jgi:hypothetical protein
MVTSVLRTVRSSSESSKGRNGGRDALRTRRGARLGGAIRSRSRCLKNHMIALLAFQYRAGHIPSPGSPGGPVVSGERLVQPGRGREDGDAPVWPRERRPLRRHFLPGRPGRASDAGPAQPRCGLLALRASSGNGSRWLHSPVCPYRPRTGRPSRAQRATPCKSTRARAPCKTLSAGGPPTPPAFAMTSPAPLLALRVGSDDTDALSSVVQHDTTYHLAIAAKEATCARSRNPHAA